MAVQIGGVWTVAASRDRKSDRRDYGLGCRRRLRSHLATPSARRRPPKGRHMSATMSANQPVFVLAPVGPNPPRMV